MQNDDHNERNWQADRATRIVGIAGALPAMGQRLNRDRKNHDADKGCEIAMDHFAPRFGQRDGAVRRRGLRSLDLFGGVGGR